MTDLHRLTKRLQFPFTVSNKIFVLITAIEKAQTSFQITETLSPQTIKRLTQSILVTSTGASNRIEGNFMNDEQIASLYKDMKITKLKTRDEQEVAGYIQLLEMVFESYTYMIFGEGLILQLHGLMLQYTEKDLGHAGKYKFGPNRVEARDREGNVVQVIFNPTDPSLTPIEMQTLVEWTISELEKKEIHPLIVIGNFLFEYLAIHPFQDGNGRTSRILTNLLMLQQGYSFVHFASHEKIVEQQKAEYYIALNTSQQTGKTEQEDISPWMLFFLQVVYKQSSQALLLSQTQDIEAFFSPMQRKIWNYIQAQGICSRKDIVNATKISEATVKQTIQKLLTMKKIERLGTTRDVRYKMI